MSELVLVTPTTGEPVTLEEAKTHLRVSGAKLDEEIRRQIKAATRYCECSVRGWRQFMPATWQLLLKDFPGNDDRIELPLPPLGTTSSTGITITYVDDDGATQTLSSTAYQVVSPTDDPGWIEPAEDETWPDDVADRPDAVRIQFPAGYRSRRLVPETVKDAVLLKMEQLFDPARIDDKLLDRTLEGLLGCEEYGAYS